MAINSGIYLYYMPINQLHTLFTVYVIIFKLIFNCKYIVF